MINILILSVGTRNKIVQYFKQELRNSEKCSGRVIATDMSPNAPALYEADEYYIVPRITASNYMDVIYDICEKEKITAVLSLIDPELSLLAKHENEFRKRGIEVIGSSYDLCELSLNKMRMYKWLKEKGYQTAKSYFSKEEFFASVSQGEINYPVIVKPISGSASLSVAVVDNPLMLESIFNEESGLMIQEYLNGQEIGADVYIDIKSKEIISIFTKKKIAMRAGETEKSISFKDKRLFELITEFVETSGFIGQIDIDLFDVNGEYYISEVNPRFGGGYPHAHECGCNHMSYIVKNLLNEVNIKAVGNYKEDIVMMKYNEIMLRELQ